MCIHIVYLIKHILMEVNCTPHYLLHDNYSIILYSPRCGLGDIDFRWHLLCTLFTRKRESRIFNLKLRKYLFLWSKTILCYQAHDFQLEIKCFDLAKNKKERNLGIISKSSCIGCICLTILGLKQLLEDCLSNNKSKPGSANYAVILIATMNWVWTLQSAKPDALSM